MSVQATFKGYAERNNSRGLILQLAFTGNYGTNGVGDLLDLNPYNAQNDPLGILDPNCAYNEILDFPPNIVAKLNDNLSGAYIQLAPNASPTLKNLGVRCFAAGGGELATNAAYPAAFTGGFATIEVFIPLQ